ncbi:MAG: ABC transporter ATP-binding protein [Spirochaetales bacterium]|nr:ABC transporter ATP-binding protein [Spirochaetales bacterium]
MQIDLSVKELTRKFGEFTAVDRVSFNVESGKFFSILGPSGCGKTTLLRMIAGFYEPTSGAIEIRGQDMAGVEPNRRPVNLVFQHLALFPMMDVKENIAFGLKRRGEKGPAVYKKVNDLLERVGLPEQANKKISQLSGGQKQRVAIARCLILEPAVLLLDEPLGALDLKLREHMKVELKKLQVQVGTTFVYITHDQSEAMVMSDYVAVMNSGHFEQLDTPQTLYNNPQSSFVAQFVGDNNQFIGILHRDENGSHYVITDDKRKYLVRESGLSDGERVEMYIRPEAVIIKPDAGKANFNTVKVLVKAILFDGANSRLLVVLDGSDKELIVSLPQNRQFDYIKSGDSIEIGWDIKSAVCFRESGVKAYDEL